MKRFLYFRLGLFSLMAVLVGGLVAFQGDTAMLNLCVEWTTGFTQHADGIALAAAAVAGTAPSGDTAAQDAAADPPEDRSIELTDETLGRLVDAALVRAVDRQVEGNPAQQRAATQVNPQPFDYDAYVVEERRLPWEKRAVNLFNAELLRYKGDTQAADALLRDVLKEQTEMGSVQRQAERTATLRVLQEATNAKGERLFKGAELKRVMDTLTDAAGGAAVPTPLAAELYVIIREGSVARQNSRPITLTNGNIDLASVATKPTATWTAEKALFTESNPALSKENWQPDKLTALMAWTREVNEDQAIALLPFRIALAGEAFLDKEDSAFFKGDGTSGFGSVTGLLNLSGATAVTMASTNTAHTDATMANLRSLRDAVPLHKRRGAKYFMHPDILSHFEGLTSTTAATNNPGFTKGADGQITRIWGHEYVLSEDMPATAAADAPFVVFGDPARYTLRGEQGGITVTQSGIAVISNGAGVVTFNAMQQDGVVLAVRERIGYATPVGFQSAFAILNTAAS